MLILAALVAAGFGGYRFGRHERLLPSIDADVAEGADSSNSPVIYYRDPDGKPFYSAEPKSAPDGRPWRPVHAGEDIGFDAEGTTKPKRLQPPAADRFCITATRWAFPTSPRCPRRTQWGWMTPLAEH